MGSQPTFRINVRLLVAELESRGKDFFCEWFLAYRSISFLVCQKTVKHGGVTKKRRLPLFQYNLSSRNLPAPFRITLALWSDPYYESVSHNVGMPSLTGKGPYPANSLRNLEFSTSLIPRLVPFFQLGYENSNPACNVHASVVLLSPCKAGSPWAGRAPLSHSNLTRAKDMALTLSPGLE